MSTLTANAQPVPHPLTTKLLIACGAAGPLLFTAVYLVEGATRPGYDAWRMAASSLSLSDQGWTQVVNFLLCGLLILGFALGLRRVLRDGRGRRAGPALIAAVGAGLIMAGIFVTDPALGYPPDTPPGPAATTTLHGALHWVLGGLVVFSCLPASCFVFARRWAADAQWKGWALYSVVTGVLMVAFFAAFAIASMREGPAGVYERVSLSLGMLWMVLFATRLLLMMRTPALSPATGR
jgi:hypothetical protein